MDKNRAEHTVWATLYGREHWKQKKPKNDGKKVAAAKYEIGAMKSCFDLRAMEFWRLRLCAVASPLCMCVCVCVFACVYGQACVFFYASVHVYDVLLLFRLCDCKIVVLAASLLSFWYADGVYAAYSLLHQSEYNLSFIVVHSLIKLVSRLYRVYIQHCSFILYIQK